MHCVVSSHDSAGIPVHERDLAELKLTDLASALQPTDDDPLLKAAHLRRILTNKYVNYPRRKHA